MAALKQLLPVVKDLAHNETDDLIINYYEEIVYLIERSIAALNNLVSAYTFTCVRLSYCVQC